MIDNTFLFTIIILPFRNIFMTFLKKVFRGNMQTLTDTLSLATTNYDEALNAMVKAKSIHFFGVQTTRPE